MTDLARLQQIATRIVAVDGVVAVTLGGSRARGTHAPDSDVDIGIYYDGSFDLAGLRAVARDVAGPEATLVEPGGWGPWVDGGGWLTVDAVATDWLYRSLARVRNSCDTALAGSVDWHRQVGHPLGFPSFGYAAEVASGLVLADPFGELARLRTILDAYPSALASALADGLGEARFVLAGARKAAPRGDVAYLAGCLFRAFGLCGHAVHAHAGRWVTNEKGLTDATDAIMPGFAARVASVFATLPDDPKSALDAAASLVADVAVLVDR